MLYAILEAVAGLRWTRQVVLLQGRIDVRRGVGHGEVEVLWADRNVGG